MKKCETPKHIIIEICSRCKRATTVATENTVIYHPKTISTTVRECDYFLAKEKTNDRRFIDKGRV